jgi:hypothetical protein
MENTALISVEKQITELHSVEISQIGTPENSVR